MGNVLALLALMLMALWFWRHRQQAELARQLIIRRCERLELELLDIHYAGIRWAPRATYKILTLYHFEFTNVPEQRYQGTLFFKRGGYYFELAPYPDAPNSLSPNEGQSASIHVLHGKKP